IWRAHQGPRPAPDAHWEAGRQTNSGVVLRHEQQLKQPSGGMRTSAKMLSVLSATWHSEGGGDQVTVA
ncbi:hypothetical protein GGI01_001467, partial [Coemansia sp. RSA 376]